MAHRPTTLVLWITINQHGITQQQQKNNRKFGFQPVEWKPPVMTAGATEMHAILLLIYRH